MAAHAQFPIAGFLPYAIGTAGILLTALQVLASDPTVWLPPQELAAYLKRYGGD